MKEKVLTGGYKNLIDITLKRDLNKQNVKFADFYLGDAMNAWRTKKLMADLNKRGTDVELLQNAGKVNVE